MSDTDVYIMLAAVVGSIFILGALITMSNRRVETAVRGMNEIMKEYSMLETLYKRRQIQKNLNVDNDVQWAKDLVMRITGVSMRLNAGLGWDFEGVHVVYYDSANGERVVFSPVPKNELLRLVNRVKKEESFATGKEMLLGRKPRSAVEREVTILNGGEFFDLEAAIVWPKYHTDVPAPNRVFMLKVKVFDLGEDTAEGQE